MRLRRYLYLLLLLIPALPLHAIPARNILHTFKQPDGTTFQARLRGDEHLHFVVDEQGHSLIRNGDGYWCYAYYQADGRKVSSGYPVGQEAPAHVLSASRYIPSEALRLRTAERRAQIGRFRSQRLEQMRRSKAFTGTSKDQKTNRHSVVILAEFSDIKMTYTREHFIDLLTKENYNFNGAHGSALDYFNEMFQGDWSFQFKVSPIVTLDHDSAYYFDDEDDVDKNPAQAVIDACKKAHDLGLNFSQFDDDEDGEVDNIIVFVAGHDQAIDGDVTNVWSHAWAIQDGAQISYSLDGVFLNSYAITTEYGQQGFTGIGTFCHEFSHTFGLPDFYDTDEVASGGLSNALFGKIDLMDSGNHNDAGRMPPHYSALDYYVLGLGTCEDIDTGNYILEPISESRRYLKYETGQEGEYFLFECRDNGSGWDQKIGGKGLLVYHIDESRRPAGRSDGFDRTLTAFERWGEDVNEVNANPTHQCGYIVTATPNINAYVIHDDGSIIDLGNQARVFYPQKSYTTFPSDPSFTLWNGDKLNLVLNNISFTGNAISFTIPSPDTPEIDQTRQDIFQDAAILQWTATDPTYAGKAIVEWGVSSSQTRQTVEVDPYEGGKYALRLEGLNGSTAYKAAIRFEEEGVSSKVVTLAFTTKAFRGGVPFIVLPTSASNGSFTSGTEIPLHVNNAQGTDGVDWYLGNSAIQPSGNGYYPLTKAGTLKAVVTYKDGTKDIIIKEIKIQ